MTARRTAYFNARQRLLALGGRRNRADAADERTAGQPATPAKGFLALLVLGARVASAQSRAVAAESDGLPLSALPAPTRFDARSTVPSAEGR